MEKNNKLKVAFIGGGVNSVVGIAHYSAINMDNDFELVSGVFSSNSQVNIQSAIEYRVPAERTYSNIETLIEKERELVDAIVILTPTDLHASQTLTIINAGIPVICEKALTTNYNDAAKIKNALIEKSGFLSVIYNYLGYPMLRELKSIISSGRLGKINHIQIEMPQEGFSKVSNDGSYIVPQQWRLQDKDVPMISLDLGIHLHILIKYLLNEIPVSVVAKNDTYGNFKSITDNVNCIIEYSNNITCNMWYSKTAIGHRNGLKIRLYGETGSAEWVQEFPELLHLADNTGRRMKIDRGDPGIEISNKKRYNRFKVGHPAGFIEALANYYQDIAAALWSYKATRQCNLVECYGIDESIEGIRLFEAINKSSANRSWTSI